MPIDAAAANNAHLTNASQTEIRVEVRHVLCVRWTECELSAVSSVALVHQAQLDGEELLALLSGVPRELRPSAARRRHADMVHQDLPERKRREQQGLRLPMSQPSHQQQREEQ